MEYKILFYGVFFFFFGYVQSISDIFGGNIHKAKVLNRFSVKYFRAIIFFGHE